MLTRRSLFKTGALAAGAAGAIGLNLDLLAGPIARTSSQWLELDRNENPWGPSPRVRKAMIDRIERGNRYLDGDELDALRDRIASREGVTRDHIVIGAGSSEILWMAAQEYLGQGRTLLQGTPTFELIGRLAERNGSKIESVPVTEKQDDDLSALRTKQKGGAALLYLNWPNNPCGSMLPASDLKSFVSEAAQKGPVFVDEAYLEYADPTLSTSMNRVVRDGGDVIVARTFSKIHGLAGMRIGYAVSQPETARRLAAHRFSVINSLGLAAAIAALDDPEFVELSRSRNVECRKVICDAFDAAGIGWIPSSTNFVWFREGDRDLAGAFREKGILIPRGRFSGGWNRVTVGTADEVQRFAEVLRGI